MRSVRSQGFILFVLFLTACQQRKEAEKTSELAPEAVFFDYMVRADEWNDSVTILLNFREFDQFGYALKLDDGETISLDGEPITGTTLKIPGTFYELQKPLASFTGEHQLIFTDKNKNKYVERFSFTPLVMTTALPPTLPAADLELEFEGLNKGDIVHIVLTDTAYASEGIEKMDTVSGNRILITAEELATLSPGPVQLELVKESVKPILQKDRAPGKFASYYGLKREFILAGKPE